MPTYKNISNKTYVNTKYNIFDVKPNQTFTIDKQINSTLLQKVDDFPEVKTFGDTEVVLQPGDSFELNVRDKDSVVIIVNNIGGGDKVLLTIDELASNLSADNIKTIDTTGIIEIKNIFFSAYNKIYLFAPSNNTSATKITLVYQYV